MSATPNGNEKSNCDLVREFILDIGLPLNLAPDALGKTATDFLNWWATPSGRIKISNKNIFQLASFIGIDENQLLCKTYDKEIIRSRLFNNKFQLPKIYTENRFSHLRSSAHIAKYISLSRGQHFCDMIMKKLNISPLIYSNQDETISLNYFIDLLEILASNGFAEDELDSLACLLFLGLEKTSLGEKFKTAKTYAKCYQILVENLNLFDSNFIYSSDLDASQLILKAFLPFDRHSQIDWKNTSIDRLLRYRKFLAGWIPYLSGLAPIRPLVTINNQRDGIEAIYVINFNHLVLMKPFSNLNLLQLQGHDF